MLEIIRKPSLLPYGIDTVKVVKAKLSDQFTVESDIAVFFKAQELDLMATADEIPGEPGFAEYNIKGKHTVHKDLQDRFDSLRLHVAVICELLREREHPKSAIDYYFTKQYLPDYLPDDVIRLVNQIKVTGVVYGGNGESAGVTIIAQRRLRYNRVLNLVTPFIKLNPEDGQETYDHCYQLQRDLDEVEREIVEYLRGKGGVLGQLNLPFGEEKSSSKKR